MYSFLQYELNSRVCRITMDRPAKRNALHGGMIREMDQAFAAATEDEGVRVIVISGSGDSFCAGADLDELRLLQDRSYAENLGDSRQLMNLYLRILGTPKPVVAEVNGPAIAGGCGLVLCADLCYASPRSSFGFTEVRIGFIPALVSVLLRRRMGDLRTRELLLTGKLIRAEKAAEMGLINGVIPTDGLPNHIGKLTTELSQEVSPQSIAKTKGLLEATSTLPLRQAMELAAAMNAEARSSEACKKGMAAFLNREKIKW
ncbi:MAG TPA: enoyl-CoA hydratase/isomerase family protein [Chitinophagaceae bacterium]|nr:enoyl-CoA hydratase/isomerase family protein [Chitinophagaceae bacterium]